MPFGRGEGRGHVLGPLLGVGEEAVVVDLDGDARDGRGGHGDSFSVGDTGASAGAMRRSLPAIGMVEPMPGMSRPGSRACQ